MLLCVDRQTVTDGSRYSSALIFRVEQSNKRFTVYHILVNTA